MNTIIGLGITFAVLSIPFGVAILLIGNSITVKGFELSIWWVYSVFGIFTVVSVVSWMIGISFWQWGIMFFVFLCALPNIIIGSQFAHWKEKHSVRNLLNSIENVSEQQKLRSAENANHTTN